MKKWPPGSLMPPYPSGPLPNDRRRQVRSRLELAEELCKEASARAQGHEELANVAGSLCANARSGLESPGSALQSVLRAKELARTLKDRAESLSFVALRLDHILGEVVSLVLRELADEEARASDPTPPELADLVAEMRPFEETSAEAKGCPDPERFAAEEDWPVK